MARKKPQVTCNYNYNYMMPMEMAPMNYMYEAGMMPEMTDMYSNGCPMPYDMYGSHLDGNPHGSGAFAGAFAGGPFFSPFLFPFFFRRRFFPFIFPFFFPFF